MKTYTLVTLLLVSAAPSAGRAEEAAVEAVPAVRRAPVKRAADVEPPPPWEPSLVGVLFELMPVGTLTARPEQGRSISVDSAFGVGVSAFFDTPLSRYFTVGLSPHAVLRTRAEQDTGRSSTQLGLRTRFTGRAPVSSDANVYARMSPGYSLILLPSYLAGSDTPSGFVFDFSVGAELRVLPKLFAIVDLGYQIGLQSTLSSQYLHLGAGLAYAF